MDAELIKDQEARKIRHEERDGLRTDIRMDLQEQLIDKGITGTHFINMIEDYVSLWDVKCELIHDIEEKGVSVKYQNGANQWGYKKNDSVSELNRVNGQMLTILRELGLRPSDNEVDHDEEFKL